MTMIKTSLREFVSLFHNQIQILFRLVRIWKLNKAYKLCLLYNTKLQKLCSSKKVVEASRLRRNVNSRDMRTKFWLEKLQDVLECWGVGVRKIAKYIKENRYMCSDVMWLRIGPSGVLLWALYEPLFPQKDENFLERLLRTSLLYVTMYFMLQYINNNKGFIYSFMYCLFKDAS
jgi:hypothetical protein